MTLPVVAGVFVAYCAYRFGRGFLTRWRELHNDGRDDA